MRRMKAIRQDLPDVNVRNVIARLQFELADAEGRANECLVRPLPIPTRVMHIFIEATAHMVRLSLVCEHLLCELPALLREAGVERVSFSVLGDSVDTVQPLEPTNCENSAFMSAISTWLSGLCDAAPHQTTSPSSRRSNDDTTGILRLVSALRQVTTATAMSGDSTAVLLVLSSNPSDVKESVALIRRSDIVLHVVGVLGTCPEDPEPYLQQLVDAAAPGSQLRLFFGAQYWAEFISNRKMQLERALDTLDKERESWPEGYTDLDEGQVIDARVLEMRLIERFLRECYAEEQQCEQELKCADRVLGRTAVERKDVVAVMRETAKCSKRTAR